MIFIEFEEELDKAYKHYESELSAVRAGRANPHILDKILVDYYGTPTPIQHMANVSVPEARQLLISPWDISNVKNICKAILASDLGLTPTDDGKVIRLNFPMLTEERRRELVKQTRKLVEDTKVVCRNARRDAIEELKKLKKDGVITEDAEASYEKDVQKKLDAISVKIDKAMDDKEKEIMQV
ncbi:MAG: ribosome recycling factor [Clostridiales bacterium]|nr:ribosome recycling factor [Clostridiales bacterium]